MILYITVFVTTLLIASKIAPVRCIEGRSTGIPRQSLINRICLFSIFVILFLVSALRINTGNDYQTYIDRFHDIYYGNFVVTEKGFNAIVAFMYKLFNGENYIAVFALFAFATCFVFLKGIYEQSRDFVFSFFLFMAFGIYFQSLNTVRYYFALAIVVYSMKFIKNSRYISFIITILIASLFHKSALIVIPLFLLARVNWKKWHIGVFAVLAISGLVFKAQYMQLMLMLYPSYVNEEEYLSEGSFSIVNIIRCLAVLVLALIYYKKAVSGDKENEFYFYLNLGALALYTCFTFVPFVSRLGYYLNISHIFFLPNLIRKIDDEKQKRFVKLGIVVFAILYFAVFLYKATAINVRILPYSTWLWDNYNILPLER